MILDKLNIFGVDFADEKAIFAGLLLGDPVLLIGPHGSAKTELGKSIATALQEYSKTKTPINENIARSIESSGLLPSDWFKYAIYDCSKMQFEEIIGFPNPTTFEKGYVSYVESPVTIWGKDLVILDEFNRQSARQQNSLFELIRSRTIYGQPTDTKMIFACMNPFSYEGTEILDEALVDRMLLFIYTQGFDKLDDDIRENIIQKMGPSDSPGLSVWGDYSNEYSTNHSFINEELSSVGREITELLEIAYRKFEYLKENSGDAYALFVNRFTNILLNPSDSTIVTNVEISSRRSGMIYRALLAYRAIELAYSEKYQTEVNDLKKSFTEIIVRTLPVGISESSGNVDSQLEYNVSRIVNTMGDFFTENNYVQVKSSMDILAELLTSNNIVRKTKLMLEYGKTDSELSHTIWNEITDISSNSEKYEKNLSQKYLITLIAGNIYHTSKDFLPSNIGEKVAQMVPTVKVLVEKCASFIEFHSNNSKFALEIREDIKSYDEPLEQVYATLLWKEISEKQYSDLTIDFESNQDKIENQVSEFSLLIEEFKKISLSKSKKETSIEEKPILTNSPF